MKITTYIHPIRTYLPCTGVGRHINAILLGFCTHPDIQVELLFSTQWLDHNGNLPSYTPLRNLPKSTFPVVENTMERSWKLLGYPQMDRYIPDDTNWLYAPMETYIPVSKCPVAITLHDIQAFETQLPWSNTWQHRLFRYKWSIWIHRALTHSRVIFTVSEFSKRRMVELLDANPSKIVVIGNGVDQPFFDIATTPPDQLEKLVPDPYIFMIGGLRQKKGGDYYLAIAHQLQQHKSELQIVIAGTSEPQYIKAAQDHPNVHLLGLVPDEDLPRLLRGSLALLFLSLYEGFGIPALEAMAAGVPAIVANRAALPEVVGDAGIIVEPGATEEIIDILLALNNNSALRNDYIQRGQLHATQYTWDRCVDRLITAFNEFA